MITLHLDPTSYPFLVEADDAEYQKHAALGLAQAFYAYCSATTDEERARIVADVTNGDEGGMFLDQFRDFLTQALPIATAEAKAMDEF